MRTLPTLLSLALLATSSGAVVIRHDRDPAVAERAGEALAAVGRVEPDGACTLIAPTWALTAAHVAAGLSDGSRVWFAGRAHAVRRVVVHPEAISPPGTPPEVDLALLELAAPVEGVGPLEIYRRADELGQTMLIVGYGDFGTGGGALARSDGKRRAVTNVIDDAGPRRLFARFDAPPQGTETEGVGARGDSGGPALLRRGATFLLAGISSASMGGKPGHYGVVDVYTRVSSYTAWIDATMREALPKQ